MTIGQHMSAQVTSSQGKRVNIRSVQEAGSLAELKKSENGIHRYERLVFKEFSVFVRSEV
jgi:hypothetical protein